MAGGITHGTSSMPRHLRWPLLGMLWTKWAMTKPKIAFQIYTQAIQTKMIVRHLQGEPMEKTLAWAESEVEGFLRT